MQSNNSTTECSPTSRCRGDDVSILEAEQPSPLSCMHRDPPAAHKRRNGNNYDPRTTPSLENGFPRMLFLDDNSTEEESTAFKIHRKLLRRRYVRREQNRKKRQHEMEKAKKLELEVEKHQIPKNSNSTALQSTSPENALGQAKQQQHLLRSPSFSVSCGRGSSCTSPGINLPCFSPLHPAKRRKTRVTS